MDWLQCQIKELFNRSGYKLLQSDDSDTMIFYNGNVTAKLSFNWDNKIEKL